LPDEDLETQFNMLFRREFTIKPNTNIPRWLTVQTDDGPVPVLVFVMNRQSLQYAGDLTPNEIAEVLAKSCGHLGTGAEYLLNTVTQLEARGMHDPGLWRLQIWSRRGSGRSDRGCCERDHVRAVGDLPLVCGEGPGSARRDERHGEYDHPLWSVLTVPESSTQMTASSGAADVIQRSP
jgi:hypothetical protein